MKSQTLPTLSTRGWHIKRIWSCNVERWGRSQASDCISELEPIMTLINAKTANPRIIFLTAYAVSSLTGSFSWARRAKTTPPTGKSIRNPYAGAKSFHEKAG